MNEEHWRQYYAARHDLEPSPFAVWAQQTIQGKRIIDFGCGNGRDTYYLRLLNDVTGVDMFAPEGPDFYRGRIEDFLKTEPKADIAYCRFLFHAIEEDLQWDILRWVQKNKAALYAEARTIYDKPNPDHERRLIDGNEFAKELISFGFHLCFYQEGFGLAPYAHNEDPHVVRFIVNAAKAAR